MQTRSVLIALASLWLAAGIGARADVVYLADGREVHGTIESQDGNIVVLRLADGSSRSFRRRDIDTIVREKKVVRETPQVPASPGVDPLKVPPTPNNIPSPAPFAGPDSARPKVPGAPTIPQTPNTPTTAANGAKPKPSETGGNPNNVTIVPEKPVAPLPSESAATTPVTAKAGEDAPATGENPVANFPQRTKRMSRRKEARVAAAFDAIQNGDDAARETARGEIQALGSEVIPYLWANAQHDSGYVRMECVKLLGMMNARNSIKRLIETFYAVMPDSGQAATFNVPYVRTIHIALEQLTGQTFVTGQANRPQVQDALKKYIEWYNANWEKLVKQVGEPDLDVTDPEFNRKLKDARMLKLSKRDFPRPQGSLPTDLVQGPAPEGSNREQPDVKKGFAEREADKKFGKELPIVSRDEAFKRDNLGDPEKAPNKDDYWKRPRDKANEAAGNTSNTARDADLKPPPPEKQGQKAADPFLRPQDLLRQQNQQ